MTTTAKNTKISPNSPAKKSPGNAPSPQTLGRITQKICRNGPNPPPPSQRPTTCKKNPLTGKPGETFQFSFFRYIAERRCKSHEAYLSNAFFTKSARTFIRFP